MALLFILILIAAIPLLLIKAKQLEKRRQKYINGIHNFMAESVEFKGVVLGNVNGKGRAAVIQFRDEVQHKTIVHRYEFSRKRYKRGTEVQLFYNEDNDSMCVVSDNPFSQKAFWCAVMCGSCCFLAVVSAVGAIWLIISEFIMLK